MRHQQTGRTLQQQRTTLPIAEVLESAREFFSRGSGIYAAFLEKQGANWMSLRGQGGEEIVIATDDPTRTLHELTSEALAEGFELEDLEVRRRSLEDVYLELTRSEAEAR